MEKRALVTGGAKRLGRAMALYLAERGFDVAVHYNGSAEDAKAVVSEIESEGQRACALRADLLSEEATQALGPEAASVLGGPIGVLVNNASIFEPDDLSNATRRSWDRAVESNLRAPFVLTQFMASQGIAASRDQNGEARAEGLVVNMIDQRVRKLSPDFMSYTVAKMGLWALTRTSAQFLAPAIRVNAIGPGPTLQGPRQRPEHFAAQREACILQRGANVDDITAALGYLIDAPAVTGQLLCIDGGQHLVWQTADVLAEA